MGEYMKDWTFDQMKKAVVNQPKGDPYEVLPAAVWRLLDLVQEHIEGEQSVPLPAAPTHIWCWKHGEVCDNRASASASSPTVNESLPVAPGLTLAEMLDVFAVARREAPLSVGPQADAIITRLEALFRAAVERKQGAYVEDLKRRYGPNGTVPDDLLMAFAEVAALRQTFTGADLGWLLSPDGSSAQRRYAGGAWGMVAYISGEFYWCALLAGMAMQACDKADSTPDAQAACDAAAGEAGA